MYKIDEKLLMYLIEIISRGIYRDIPFGEIYNVINALRTLEKIDTSEQDNKKTMDTDSNHEWFRFFYKIY